MLRNLWIILLIFLIIISGTFYLVKRITIWWIIMVTGLILLIVAYILYKPGDRGKRFRYMILLIIIGSILLAISALIWFMSTISEQDMIESSI